MAKPTIMLQPRRPGKATAAQLAQAHTVAHLSGTLADALRSPLLARCLEITAEALATGRAHPNEYRPPPAAPPPDPARSASTRTTPNHNPPRRDVKRASAGDEED